MLTIDLGGEWTFQQTGKPAGNDKETASNSKSD